MKYTKTVPYFKKGDKVKKRSEVGNTGKTKEEIMAEARRNQAIEKKVQAADAEKAKTANNVSKPKKDLSGTSSKTKPYSGNISKPNKYLSGTSSKAKTASIVAPVGRTVAKRKDQAFQEEAERKAKESKTSKDKTSKDKTSKDKTSAGVEQSFLPGITRPVTSRYGYITQGPAAESITNRQQHSIHVSRLPEIGEETEPVKVGRTYINEAGEEKPLEANRFIWPSGIDNTFLATTDNGEHIFQRDIHNGDTIYVNRKGEPPAASELPLYKKIFADADKAIWDRRTRIVEEEAERKAKEEEQQNRINIYVENNGSSDPKHYKREFVTDATGAQVPIYFSGTDPENLERIRDFVAHDQAQKIFDKIDSGELKKHQQGGIINKFQRGNVLTNREQHLVDVSRLPKLSIPQVWSRKLFGTGPKPVETGRTHLNKDGEQVPEVGNRIIMPGGRDNTTITRGTNYGSGWLTSQRNIQKGDTTYLTPGGNAPSAADLPRYKRVFDNADKKIWGSMGYQQGGAIQQQGVDKEALVADFVVRYLKTMGVPEEAIVTPEGTVNPEYEKELTAVIKEKDSPEFWEAYQSSPDEVVTQVVRERNPNAVTMARKGTKLKRLSQFRIYRK